MMGRTVPEVDVNEDETAIPLPAPRKRGVVGRVGCVGALLLWLIVILFPAFLLVLAVQGEVTVWHGSDVPEPGLHPLLQVNLLMEIQTRGVSITTSTPSTQPGDLTCMQTEVRFVLWQGTGDNVGYCDCYTRANAQAPWQFVRMGQGACAVLSTKD
ncbi:MAG: hypothetical protein H7Y11_09455 [Armatimonadetes bacterium]|nr:hypothetical protein [Anaerolineae bacterium]